MSHIGPLEVLRFWFEELDPADWWKSSDALDARIREQFGSLHAAASRMELHCWRCEPAGRLAEVIVLDQFSRNLYRDRPEAFAQDGAALALAQEAVSCGDDQRVTTAQRSFFYLPFMHSESALIHARAVELFAQPGLEGNLEYELKHRAIIERFGRYPHRNAALGRTSSAEELAFLRQPGSSF